MKNNVQNEYDHLDIEKKWQKEWARKKVYKTEAPSTRSGQAKKKKCYVLDMFPYPSGLGLHVGHPKGYIGSDVFARMRRMQGFNVLHPMGYDAFGLPAEQYALEHNIAPQKAVIENVKTFERQLNKICLSYVWDRKVNTTDPDFYRWTQWIFLKLFGSWYGSTGSPQATQKARPISELIKIFEKDGNQKVNSVSGKVQVFSASDWKAMDEKTKQDVLMKYRLAYEGYSEVNWCPVLGTVLANDEVVDSSKGLVSERGGFLVVKKEMRQWFLRITAYAPRLLAGLDTLDWSSHIKEIQRNWIGESHGLLFTAKVKDSDMVIETFNAHFQACYADTFFVIAPDHPMLPKLVEGVANETEILSKAREIVDKRAKFSEGEYREIDGIFTGRYVVDPLGNGDLPIWVASFALKDYGTGIVKCSAHDERDFAFAKKFNIKLKTVLLPTNEHLGKKVLNQEICFSDMVNGILTEPKELMGKIAGEATKDIIKYVTSRGFAKVHTTYKMRDAVFARQRYWGEPIPLRHDKDGIIHELREKDLPLKLPNVKSYVPTGTGESPLAGVSSWVKAGLETNTMPGWAGSSWYFLRYMDPKNKKAFADINAIKYWKNVDMYVGGQEHATGHLLYSRFWYKFMKDYGLVVTEEPFQTLRNQGMILGSDNRKMSKRWGNVINPDDIVKIYGADTLRVYEMFMGPFEASLPWSTDNIIGSRRFLEKVWKIKQKVIKKGKVDSKFEVLLYKTIKKISEDIEGFSFNTSISSMMILVNEMEKLESVRQSDFELFLKILSPFAPHITEELWKQLGHKSFLVLEKWPKVDSKKTQELEVKIVVQINGKVRASFDTHFGAREDEAVSGARALREVEKWLINKEIIKTVFVPNRLINFVTK
ncbi:MAG: Leucine-tRNA ligase [Parcubacteria group bacterium GW2011_GWC1_39_12]|nr:MAG: Leucine-tRNA ligase [Parcubacteria group bacterium GW2011_GWC1_39_12]